MADITCSNFSRRSLAGICFMSLHVLNLAVAYCRDRSMARSPRKWEIISRRNCGTTQTRTQPKPKSILRVNEEQSDHESNKCSRLRSQAKANLNPISSPASQLPPSVPRLEPKELKNRSAHACRAPHRTLRNWDEAPYTLAAAIPLTCRHGQTRKYCTTPCLSATQVD
jgi:hypothetical protein